MDVLCSYIDYEMKLEELRELRWKDLPNGGECIWQCSILCSTYSVFLPMVYELALRSKWEIVLF